MLRLIGVKASASSGLVIRSSLLVVTHLTPALTPLVIDSLAPGEQAIGLIISNPVAWTGTGVPNLSVEAEGGSAVPFGTINLENSVDTPQPGSSGLTTAADSFLENILFNPAAASAPQPVVAVIDDGSGGDPHAASGEATIQLLICEFGA